MTAVIRFPDLSGMIENLRIAIKPTEADSKQLAIAACNIIYTRTVNQGVDKNGIQFMPYSSMPIYIGGKYASIARSAGGRTTYLDKNRKRLTGKKTKGGKDSRTGQMKTTYFQTGYAQFKGGLSAPGSAQTGVVNLAVTGNLMGSQIFTDGQTDAAWGVGEATPTGFRLTFTRAEEAKIADGLIERGRDFWGVAEIKEEKDELERLLAELMRKRVAEAVRMGIHAR